MQIGNLHDVRAILLNPITGGPELHSPDDIDALVSSYGGQRCLGVVGNRETECATVRGPVRYTVPEIQTVNGASLPDGVVTSLLLEYADRVRETL